MPRVRVLVLVVTAPGVKTRAEQILDRIWVVATDRHFEVPPLVGIAVGQETGSSIEQHCQRRGAAPQQGGLKGRIRDAGPDLAAVEPPWGRRQHSPSSGNRFP